MTMEGGTTLASSPMTVAPSTIKKAPMTYGIENLAISEGARSRAALTQSTPPKYKDQRKSTKSTRRQPPVQESPYSAVRTRVREQYGLESSSISSVMPDIPSSAPPTSSPAPPATPLSIRRIQNYNNGISDSTPNSGSNSASSAYLPLPLLTTLPASVLKKGKGAPLLHRVLDSNWRLQATPLKEGAAAPAGSSSPLSSPHLASRILLSPGTPSSRDIDDEHELPAGMSPPVTMQFSIPKSRIQRTPARDVARKMVDDILQKTKAQDVENFAVPNGRVLNVGDAGSPRVVTAAGEDDGTMVGGLGNWRT